MKPRLWLRARNITIPQFSRMIDKTPSSTYEYMYDGAVPRKETMERIKLATLDSIRIEDFYEAELTPFDRKIEEMLDKNLSLWGWKINNE